MTPDRNLTLEDRARLTEIQDLLLERIIERKSKLNEVRTDVLTARQGLPKVSQTSVAVSAIARPRSTPDESWFEKVRTGLCPGGSGFELPVPRAMQGHCQVASGGPAIGKTGSAGCHAVGATSARSCHVQKAALRAVRYWLALR